MTHVINASVSTKQIGCRNLMADPECDILSNKTMSYNVCLCKRSHIESPNEQRAVQVIYIHVLQVIHTETICSV